MPTYAGFGPEGILGLDGSPLVNVEISVYEDGTNTLATLYSSSTGGAQANPVSTDSYGNLVFWLAGGDYELEYNGHRVAFSTYVTDNVEHAAQHNAGEGDPISGLSPSQITGTAAVLGANTFTGNQTLSNVNVVLGTTTGTKIGTATSQKLGFFNATPVIQQTGNALDALEALGLVASATLAVADITGLGTAAVADTGTGASNVILGNDARLTDTRTPSAASIVDAMIATTLSPSKITGTAAILGANTFTAQQSINGTADVAQLIVKGASGQSNAIQEWQNNSGTVLTRIGASGFVGTQGGFGHNTTLQPMILPAAGSLTALSQNAAHIPWTVKGAASQSADLQTWINSSSTVLASVSAAGAGTFNGVTVAAGYDINASHAAGVTNTRYGSQAMRVAASGTHNTCFGYYSMVALTSGSFNLAVGSTSLAALTTGSRNIGFGYGTFYNLQTGSDNTSVGMSALFSTTGSQNTAVGSGAGYYATSGSANIYLGYYAGLYATTQSNELFINSIDRTNRAGDIAGSIIYGVQNATAASQTLTLNAAVTAVYGLTSNAATSIVGVADVSQLTVKGASGQSNSIQEWQNNSGTVLTRVGSSGFIGTQGGFGHNTAGQPYILPASGSLTALSQNAAHVAWTVKGAAAQTASLQTWENSAGTVLLSVDSGGALVGGSPVSVKLWNRTVQGTGGGSLYIGGSATGAATDGVVIDGNATTFSTGVTSGEWSSLRVGQNNNPNASSTAIHNAILVNPTINYASGGAGSYNALRIKVTETALPSGDNYLIRASAGAAGTTEKFSVKNDGVVFIANSSAPATPTGGGAIFLEGGALKFIGSSGTITTIAEA